MSDSKQLAEFPQIETERLILRKLSLADVNDIFEYASNPEVSEFLPWETHKTIEDTHFFLELVEAQFNESNIIVLGIELKAEKKLIGTIALRNWDKADRCIDLGYVISNNYWNKGFTTEAVKVVIKYGFEELNANRVEAHCDENNIASYRVMEKAGMKYEGTLRQKVLMKNKFVNMRFYSVLKEEYNK
ncbi:MAG: GNAT family protein [Ignavibacteriales bacterium]|nr:GNAT family protein [Ignavibacteriales bacterium]